MKTQKLLLSILFLFISNTLLFAQTSGAEVHVGLKSFQPKFTLSTENPDSDINSKLVPTAGISYLQVVAKDISIQYSFDFSSFTTEFTEPSTFNDYIDEPPSEFMVNSYNLKSGIALNVRVMGFYEVIENLNLGLGLGTDRLTLSVEDQGSIDSRLGSELDREKSLNINFVSGIAFAKDAIRLDLQYQIGLSNFNSDFSDPFILDQYNKISLNQLSLTIGYMLNQN